VRVLLDSNIPRGFAALLPGHLAETTHRRGWSDLDDGPLLTAVESEYDAFVTMDQSLRYQQNLKGRRIRIEVVGAARNTLPALAPIASAVLNALREMGPGELRVVGG
jgi:predicted nuclease of predicted toxin-antitoxin system